jgi:5-methylthioadenosine/S-adenosylhomocysteine deaminase
MIRGGIVGFGDQYFFMDSVARAVLESGLRANLCWCTFGDEGGEIGGSLAAVAAFAEAWQSAGAGRIKTSLGPHSPYLCSPQFLARTAAVAARLGLGIHLRVAESQEQLEFSMLAYDMTPIEVLDKNGVLDVPVVAANAAYMTEVDIAILAARGASVVACPSAQRAAGLAQTPIRALQAARIPVGLGTDGVGLAGSLDLFGAVHDTGIGLGGETSQRAEALQLVTLGSAQILGFPKSGVLAPGYTADLVLIDSRKPQLWPLQDPLRSVLTTVRPGDVTHVMVDGEWVLRNGELTTIDEERALAETAARGLRLRERAAASQSPQ